MKKYLIGWLQLLWGIFKFATVMVCLATAFMLFPLFTEISQRLIDDGSEGARYSPTVFLLTGVIWCIYFYCKVVQDFKKKHNPLFNEEKVFAFIRRKLQHKKTNRKEDM